MSEEPRAEWIKCVRRSHAEHVNETWCGQPISAFDWCFVDANHAAENGLQGGRLVACPECVAKITAALRAADLP